MNGDGRTVTGSSILSERRRGGRWRAEFPYHWDADELVNRRELLQLAVLTSGALFAGTAVLAILGRLRDRRRGDPQPITRADAVAEGEAFYFNFPGDDDQAILLHLPGGEFVAFSQTCTHLSCSVYFQPEKDRLYCPCHEGVFDPRTGAPVAGPPQRPLPRIALREENGMLIAVEEAP
jgi:nitrite reductase/ring-hydroxylating ferredoxin subunit